MKQKMTSPRSRTRERASHFVPYGESQLEEAIRAEVLPDIQVAVRGEYAERIDEAGVLKRIWLRWRMHAEISRRVELEIAADLPSDRALY